MKANARASFSEEQAIRHQQRHGFPVEHIRKGSTPRTGAAPASFSPPDRPDTRPKRLRGSSKRKRTKTELEFSLILSRDLHAGLIHSFQEQSLTLVIGDGCRYTPDFSVWLLDGTLKCIEVKGPYIREDALVKYKSAVRQYPKIQFELHQRQKGGQWSKLL